MVCKKRLLLFFFPVVLAVVAGAWECPGSLGIAINTGDRELERVRFALSPRGWAGGLLERHGSFTARNVVVYSSVREGKIPLGRGQEVPLVPCCGGVDFSQSLAEAQYMREHTFSRMQRQFSADTTWFLSTEEDVWWDIEGLCGVIEAFEGNDEEPALLGGGWTKADRVAAIFGPYIIMNRPLLSLFANETLLRACRDDLLLPGNNLRENDVYPGARYNNDHLITHCALSFFPRATGLNIAFDVRLSFSKPPGIYAHNGITWNESVRADCLADHGADTDAIIAYHHATIDDMIFLENRKRARMVNQTTNTTTDSSSKDLLLLSQARKIELRARCDKRDDAKLLKNILGHKLYFKHRNETPPLDYFDKVLP